MTGLAVGLALLGLSVLVVTVRFVRGPSALDRLVALDAIVAVVLAILLVLAALTGESTLVPVAVATSLVGFLGSSTVARFLTHGDRGAARPALDTSEPRGPDPEGS